MELQVSEEVMNELMEMTTNEGPIKLTLEKDEKKFELDCVLTGRQVTKDHYLPLDYKVALKMTQTGRPHNWIPRDKFIACSRCGIIQREDGKSKPCFGPVKITTRDKK